jgi:hypothetical protein
MVVVQARVGRVSGGCVRRGARHACARCWAPWVRPVTPPRDSAAAGQATPGTSATSVQGVTHRNLVRPVLQHTNLVDPDQIGRLCYLDPDPE